MTAVIIALSMCVFLLLVAVAILLFLKRKQDQSIVMLIKSIHEFMNSGKQIDYSVEDNQFAQLQNGISDLEHMIVLEKNNTSSVIKNNTEFISDISHQLKTPLAGLRLYCEMDHGKKPTEHTLKELILIEKMENLIFRLLRLEKIKRDSYEMDFKNYQVANVINEVLCGFDSLYPKKHYIVKGSSFLRCDKGWLAEAISNVIKNASEHTAEDGMIAIQIEHTDRATIIEINDDGGGVAEKELPNLFIRFYPNHHALPGSTGIGLAITKAIIEKHHGTICAENKNGGLCVTMCIPHIDGCITI